MRKLFVLFTAIALVAAFTLPATAGTWGFYGSARMQTFFASEDEPLGDDDNTRWDLQGNARIGANVKNGAVGGGFEYGHTSASGATLRKLFGTYDFGGGELMVGQNYTPIDVFDSNQVFDGDEDLLSFGAMYTGRQPMVQLKMNDFKVALVKNHGTSDLGTDGGVEDILPKLEASYNLKTGPARFLFVGGISTYNADPDGIDKSITSYMLGASAKVVSGPATIAVNAWLGSNVGTLGMYHQGVDDPVLTPDGSVEDTTSYGGILVGSYKATPMVTFEVGVGWTLNDNDTFLEDDEALSYYGNAVINIAPGFFIVPEIGIQDFGDGPLGVDEGKITYFGAKWQINF